MTWVDNILTKSCRGPHSIGSLTSSSGAVAAQVQEHDAALAALGWQRCDLDAHYSAHVAHAGNNHLVLTVRERSLLPSFMP